MRKSDGTYDNTEHILKCQDLFNETGDTTYLFEMQADLKHCIKSLLIKQARGYIYKGLDELADDITLAWMCDFKRRREQGKPFHMTSPISYAYFKVLEYMPKDQGFWAKTEQLLDTADQFFAKDYGDQNIIIDERESEEEYE